MQPIANQSNLLFAARRYFNRDGTTQMVMVYPKTGARLEESEKILEKNGISLGDFFYRSNVGYTAYTKAPPMNGFQVQIEGNVATVRRVPGKIVQGLGAKVFESAYFGRAICRAGVYSPDAGEYTVDIGLLEDPIKLPNGWELNFEATNYMKIFPNPLPVTPTPTRVSPFDPVPPPQTPTFYGNGFSQFSDLTTRPADPLAHLTPQFDAKMNLFSPIDPPRRLPDPSLFGNRVPNAPSPAPSNSSTYLPSIPNRPGSNPHTPIPKPRSNTPMNQKPPTPNYGAGGSPIKFLFAGRKYYTPDGVVHLILVDPKTGENFVEKEAILNEKNIQLGSFLRAKFQIGAGLSNFSPAKHTANLHVTTEGNVAYIANIRGIAIEHQGRMLFQTPLFTNALIQQNNLAPGKYFMRVSLLPTPFALSDGTNLYFEATNPRPIIKPPPKTPVQGSGFPIVGTGFEAPKKTEKVINGAGFKENTPQTFKLRAVVMSFIEKDNVRTHFLWILDKQAEGRVMDKNCKLEKGHFFEGIFQMNAQGKWNCQKYEQPINPPLMQGGLDANGTIWFSVKVEKFKAANGNMKFAEAQAKYIGKIVDTEEKLSEGCNGKQVKVQRKGVAKNDYVWAVVG